MTAKTGTPYSGIGSAEVDDWSENIYRALSDWPVAQDGQWSRWEPGYLLLTVHKIAGEAIDRIALDTADQEVTVEFGYWIDHIDNPVSIAPNPEASARQAKELVQQWLDNKFKTAVFTNAEGKWCGTTVIQPGNLDAEIREAAQNHRERSPVRVEIRSPHKRNWITVTVDPKWLVAPKLSPNRLP